MMMTALSVVRAWLQSSQRNITRCITPERGHNNIAFSRRTNRISFLHPPRRKDIEEISSLLVYRRANFVRRNARTARLLLFSLLRYYLYCVLCMLQLLLRLKASSRYRATRKVGKVLASNSRYQVQHYQAIIVVIAIWILFINKIYYWTC